MKSLILKNGVALEFTESSTILDLVNVFDNFESIDSIRPLLTADNLDGATFDGEPVSNVIPLYISAQAIDGESVVVHCMNRYKTDVEVLQETQAQQDDVINYLLMEI